MKLYLCQHGDCVDKSIDINRSLTTEAKGQLDNMSKWLKSKNVTIDLIYHSGKLRAQQTAEIYQKNLEIKEFKQLDGINPLDDVEPIIKTFIEKGEKNILLVSHLPFVSKMVSYLILGHIDIKVVSFSPGTIIELEKNEQKWAINWLIKPRFF